MNDAILLIALTKDSEKELDAAEGIIRELMRRFRKSMKIKRLDYEIARECGCCAAARQILEAAIRSCGGILRCGCTGKRQNAAFGENAFAVEYVIGEKSVIMPAYGSFSEAENGNITEKTTVSEENLRYACKYAFKKAGERAFLPVICLRGENTFRESALLCEAEALTPAYKVNDMRLFEPWHFMREYRAGRDVILSDIKSGMSVVDFLLSQRRINDCYICEHSTNARVYCPMESLYEQKENYFLVRLLLCAAEMLENELKLKTEAQWLKRAVATAEQICINAPREDFLLQIKNVINEKMRNRRID